MNVPSDKINTTQASADPIFPVYYKNFKIALKLNILVTRSSIFAHTRNHA